MIKDKQAARCPSITLWLFGFKGGKVAGKPLTHAAKRRVSVQGTPHTHEVRNYNESWITQSPPFQLNINEATVSSVQYDTSQTRLMLKLVGGFCMLFISYQILCNS